MKKLTLTNAEYAHLKEIYQAELEKAQSRIEHLTAILKKLDSGFVSESKDEIVPIQKPKQEQFPVNLAEKPRRGRKPKQKEEVDLFKPKSKRGRKPKSPEKIIESPKTARGRKPNNTSESEVVAEVKAVRTKKRVKKPIKKGVGKKKVKWNDFILNLISTRNNALLSTEITNEAATHFKIKDADLPRMRLVISGALSKLITNEKKLQAEKIEGAREKYYGLTEWFDSTGKLLPNYSRNK